MRIYLIGYMCSGKSKAGKTLASAMRHKFLDTDSMIEEETGENVRDIFEKKGEEYFRKIESAVLHKTGTSPKLIIATGGGLPCFHDNMSWMNEHGITVFLEANEGLLFHRIALSRQGRPLVEKLNDIELMERISRDLTVRTPFYNRARLKVNAANINLKSLQQKIEKLK